jgi:hypothetical protein
MFPVDKSSDVLKSSESVSMKRRAWLPTRQKPSLPYCGFGRRQTIIPGTQKHGEDDISASQHH